MNLYEQNRLKVSQNITGMYSTPEEQVSKAIEVEYIVEKGKKANVGEIRIWGDEKYQKTANGWVSVKKLEKEAKKDGDKEVDSNKTVKKENKKNNLFKEGDVVLYEGGEYVAIPAGLNGPKGHFLLKNLKNGSYLDVRDPVTNKLGYKVVSPSDLKHARKWKSGTVKNQENLDFFSKKDLVKDGARFDQHHVDYLSMMETIAKDTLGDKNYVFRKFNVGKIGRISMSFEAYNKEKDQIEVFYMYTPSNYSHHSPTAYRTLYDVDKSYTDGYSSNSFIHQMSHKTEKEDFEYTSEKKDEQYTKSYPPELKAFFSSIKKLIND